MGVNCQVSIPDLLTRHPATNYHRVSYKENPIRRRKHSSLHDFFLVPIVGVHAPTVYRFPVIASVIRTPFARGSLDLIDIWTLVSLNLPWHISISITSSPSLAATPHEQNPRFLDLLQAQNRV